MAEVKARPILFSDAMVRALLEGRKTQTRRVVKPQPYHVDHGGKSGAVIGNRAGFVEALCPYGKTGDLLYVRECWAYQIHSLSAKTAEEGPFEYRADGSEQYRLCDRWRPSIHMPRWASRLTLRISDVLIHRLRYMTEGDVISEGISAPPMIRTSIQVNQLWEDWVSLWDSINAARGYGWDANPWVWVLKFDVIQKNVDEVLKQ